MGHVRKINVELIGATGLKNSEYFGKSDPYVILSIGTTEFKSKVAVDQAAAPVWDEKFVIPALESDTELLIRILNENNMATDDEIGRVVIPLAQYRHGGSASSFSVQCNGKPQGELKMNLAFESEGDHESQSLIEKIEGLFVGEKKEHHDDESVKEKTEELKQEAEETKEEKAEEKKEEPEEKIEEAEEKAEEKAEEEKKEEPEEKIEEAEGKAEEKAEEKKEELEEKTEEKAEEQEKKHKHKHHHHHLSFHLFRKHHKKSDGESSSSSSDSDSDKEGKSGV